MDCYYVGKFDEERINARAKSDLLSVALDSVERELEYGSKKGFLFIKSSSDTSNKEDMFALCNNLFSVILNDVDLSCIGSSATSTGMSVIYWKLSDREYQFIKNNLEKVSFASGYKILDDEQAVLLYL